MSEPIEVLAGPSGSAYADCVVCHKSYSAFGISPDASKQVVQRWVAKHIRNEHTAEGSQ